MNRLTQTPFGDDITNFISTSFREVFDLPMDTLFSTMQPLFPDWKTVMKTPKKEPQLGVHVFKISLGKVWRKIAIKGDVDLHSFGEVILGAFEFDNDHLHVFS